MRTISCHGLGVSGKSLLLDTVKELFEGNEELFEGLAVHPGWDWTVRHPVLRLGFGMGNYKDPAYLTKNNPRSTGHSAMRTQGSRRITQRRRTG